MRFDAHGRLGYSYMELESNGQEPLSRGDLGLLAQGMAAATAARLQRPITAFIELIQQPGGTKEYGATNYGSFSTLCRSIVQFISSSGTRIRIVV